MAVKIRLQRRGRKAAPHYAIVVADSRAKRDGRFIEKIGFYNPITEPAQLYVDSASAIKWLQNGAQPTDTARALLRQAGITLRYALIKQGKDEETAQRIFDRWWTDKMSKPKQHFVLVDISGKPLPGQPEMKIERPSPRPQPAAPKVKPQPEAAPAEGEATEDAEAPQA